MVPKNELVTVYCRRILSDACVQNFAERRFDPEILTLPALTVRALVPVPRGHKCRFK